MHDLHGLGVVEPRIAVRLIVLLQPLLVQTDAAARALGDALLTGHLEVEAAEDAANASLKGANKKSSGSTKVTQAEIARRQALMAMAKGAPKKSAKSEVVKAPKIEANTNRQTDTVEATGIDAALSALEGDEGKKSKMTYKEFEAKVLPEIQAENPGLKMSQAKDKASKMWDRAPENPKNQEK